MSMWNNELFVYVVTCNCGNNQIGYYIGTYGGFNVETRWHEHKTRRGSRFTMKYEPISFKRVGRFPKKTAYFYENQLTVYYMRKCGFRYVRGGDHLWMKHGCHLYNNLTFWVPKVLRPALKAGKLGLWDDLEEYPLVKCV
jgi:predicted GIY-YIG superfamily endonuclease